MLPACACILKLSVRGETMRFSRAVVLIASVALLAVSCGTSAANSNQPVFIYNHSMQAFEFSDNCPNGCFLSIKPLVTTSEQALRILQHSPDIDHSTITMEKGGLVARWVPALLADNFERWGFSVGIGTSGGIVQAVNARPVAMTIDDFEKLLGEPDKIRVDGFMPPDAPYEFCYWLYYSKWQVELFHLCVGTVDGPKPSDGVDGVVLNADIRKEGYKPWQGYGKMVQYMSPDQLKDYEQFTGDYRFGPRPPTATPTMIPQGGSYGCGTPPPCGAPTTTAQMYWPSYTDQLAFEQTIRDFATAIERRNYTSAKQYATPEFAAYLERLTSGTSAGTDGFSMAILHGYPMMLVQLKPYYENGQCPPDFNVLQTRPTVDFLVEFDFVDAQGNHTQAGGYVEGVKGADGNYRIGGFASCT